MTLLKESYLCHLLSLLLAAYQHSALHRLAVRLGAWCSRQIEESAILRPLCREGAAARSWPDSQACKLFSRLVNLPGRLLRFWRGPLKPASSPSWPSAWGMRPPWPRAG